MPIVLNKEELATNVLRKCALDILEAGLEAVNTEKILRKKLRIENGVLYVKNGEEETSVGLPSPKSGRGPHEVGSEGEGKIIFIGIGKCALDGAGAIEDILGDYLTSGAVIDVKAASAEATAGRSKIKYFQGTHPLPSEQNIAATKEILKLVENLTEKDLVIALISGGGSSLFELPTIPLEELIQKTKELTAKGADIYELNNFRKSVSQVKGGKFAKLCQPARVISLIFSDVLGNDISMVASGPTVVRGVVEKDSLRSQDASHISLQESSQPPLNILLASNHDALTAMKSKAQKIGFSSFIETETLSGNASEVGKILAEREPNPQTCILFGGETTVKINENHGKGGRNQEMALSALSYMQADSVLVCASSDGWDNTDHAGAMADRELLQKAKDLNLSPQKYLKKSDSYNFFKKVKDGAIYTEKLGSNVSDLVILLCR